jgi:hypothetical protein
MHCSHCGQPIDSATVSVEPGPGGKTAPGTMLIADALSARSQSMTGDRSTTLWWA